VERKSGYALIAKVSNKTSDLLSQAIITQLNPVTPLVNTLTFDNVKKFAEHGRIDTALQSTTYFADPFASWQRGSNENFNGLLRQYIPKKRPLSTVTNKVLRMIQAELNSRPSKRLGYKTPNEVFMQS
jgi:IS30 family transposase